MDKALAIIVLLVLVFGGPRRLYYKSLIRYRTTPIYAESIYG